jgi:hypothetical protein
MKTLIKNGRVVTAVDETAVFLQDPHFTFLRDDPGFQKLVKK